MGYSTGKILQFQFESNNPIGICEIAIYGVDAQTQAETIWTKDVTTSDIRYMDGKVGIGTIPTHGKLDVAGNITISESLSASMVRPADLGSGAIDFTNNGFGYQYAAKLFTFRNPDYSEAYGITNDYGSGTSAQLSLIAKQATGSIGFYTGAPATEKIRILANGNLGIGTIPASKLHIAGGDLRVDGNAIINGVLKFGDPTGTSTGFLSIGNATCCYNTYAEYRGNVYFRSNTFGDGTTNVTLGLQSNGTVVIGNYVRYNNSVQDTQGAKLLVNGSILCEKVKVIADVPSSDYVFGNNYKLKSLKDLEKYVNTHQHLPEVPSSEEFKRDGYSIGQMDDILLRKVEELTLYSIQLKKENDAQTRANVDMQKQLLEMKKEMELLKKAVAR